MKHFVLLSCLSIMLAACDTGTHTTTKNVDNTERNVRDRSDTLTPGDQSESEADRTITQKIRQALMSDNSLSTNAKNVKIITINGTVTLRGVVNSDQEKNAIVNKAQQVSGVKKVTNLLEVKS